MICTKFFLFLARSSIYNEYIAIVNLYMAERVANITDQMTKTILLSQLGSKYEMSQLHEILSLRSHLTFFTYRSVLQGGSPSGMIFVPPDLIMTFPVHKQH